MAHGVDIGHFREVPSSQLRSLVLMKLKLTQQKRHKKYCNNSCNTEKQKYCVAILRKCCNQY